MTLHQHDVAGLESSEAATETASAVDDCRRAGTFFLGWLILAAAMSLSGNVGHALLIAPSETRWLAALAALVPPTVLLAATHSATWLVRARSVGWVYWVALALTAALALGSFALSFDALRSFAVMLGIRESMSWIWPAVIDVAIARDAVLAVADQAQAGQDVARGRSEAGSNTFVDFGAHRRLYRAGRDRADG